MQRFVCIHGHFYQPPREDPWSGQVRVEPSARPYHDWNERITAECYAPNANSPMMERSGRFADFVNNYGWISFNFGPTLLRWLEKNSSEVYEAILEADRLSASRFNGHGSAIAQVYNHMIMPLASSREKLTQTLWGMEDFERRFGRPPEGMWLPETAVDTESLETLAECGIKFTILSPHQAAAVRTPGSRAWTDVTGGRIDTRSAYSCPLPSGREITIFFFDRVLSNNIAFGDLLDSGAKLTRALLGGFAPREGPQLVNVASDGETFGHHHKNGHVVLTDSIARIEKGGQAKVANYGMFLALAPPTKEVRIVEQTSWSCPHGVERWRSNCGCASEIKHGYNQEWRVPLRASLDWLGSSLARVYDREAPRYFKDSAAAMKDPPSRVSDAFRGDSAENRKVAAELLEMVECSELMKASCAWFWEDISRMEPVQALKLASRAMELASKAGGSSLEQEFKRMLSAAKPNEKRYKTGAELYEEVAERKGVET